MSMKTATEDSFDAEVLGAEMPVVVDFWSETCAPCKAIASILERIAEANAGRFLVTKLNIDEHPAIAERFSVRGAPTLKVFIDGEAVATRVGAAPKSVIQSWIATSLEPAGVSVV